MRQKTVFQELLQQLDTFTSTANTDEVRAKLAHIGILKAELLSLVSEGLADGEALREMAFAERKLKERLAELLKHELSGLFD